MTSSHKVTTLSKSVLDEYFEFQSLQRSDRIDTDVITVEQLVGYSRSTLSKIPPIHVVAEKQSYQGFETTPVNVSGWEANKVVLRPIGYAGVVAHAQPNDIAMYQSV